MKLRGLRVALAICFYLPGDSTVIVLDTLLRRVRELGVHVRRLFLDRGFAGIEVMAYLIQHKQPALIACPNRGKTGGTRAAGGDGGSTDAIGCSIKRVLRRP